LLPVSFAQYSVSTKLEIYTAFLFRENRKHGTDGQTDEWDATRNATSYRGPHNNTCDRYG